MTVSNRSFIVKGWPAWCLSMVVALGLIDVAERMIEVIF